MAVEAPAMGSPPAIEILVLFPGLGVELRDPGFDLAFGLEGPSEMR